MLMKAQKLRVLMVSEAFRPSSWFSPRLSGKAGFISRSGTVGLVKGGGAYQTAQWQGHKGRGERSRGGGTEREKTDQALEFQHRNSIFPLSSLMLGSARHMNPPHKHLQVTN